ncbi:hypothetical protein BSLA_01f1447 [Burkholderia stabilis]|nr:hypothetical protein BSLA_01f1447 [Burkholderia stabilis]
MLSSSAMRIRMLLTDGRQGVHAGAAVSEVIRVQRSPHCGLA